jgi:polyhydroxybutyrate depolymerase
MFVGASTMTAASSILVDAGRGNVLVQVPDSYDPDVPTPLLIMLHGYGISGVLNESWFQFLGYAESNGYIYTYPNGRLNDQGNYFWDATPFCCDIEEPNGDEDSIYLRALIKAIEDELNVDPQRIYFAGYSNGAIMAFRMACDHSEKIAAIVSFAGAMFMPENANNDPSDGEDYCQPSQSIHILQIHGTNDPVLFYNGGTINIFPGTPLQGQPYPGAQDSVDIWSEFHNLCNKNLTQSGGTIDLVTNIAGAETTVLRWPSQCHVAGSTEHWRINGGVHNIAGLLTDEFRTRVFEFLEAHPKESVRFADKTTLIWPAVPVAHSYKTYRGDLADLDDLDDDGQPDVGYGSCASVVDPDETDTVFRDTEEPLAATGFFYLMSYVDNIPPPGGHAEGGLGKTGAGQHRENLAPCP